MAPLPAVPQGARSLGPASATQVISADVALVPRNEAQLDAFAEAVTSTSSPLSGRYLAPGRFAAEFGPSASAVEAVTAALRADGLSVGSERDGGLLIAFSGKERQVAAAFGTTFDNYRLAGGSVAYAETSTPTLPESITPDLEAVVGLDDLSRPTPVAALEGGTGHATARTSASVALGA